MSPWRVFVKVRCFKDHGDIRDANFLPEKSLLDLRKRHELVRFPRRHLERVSAKNQNPSFAHLLDKTSRNRDEMHESGSDVGLRVDALRRIETLVRDEQPIAAEQFRRSHFDSIRSRTSGWPENCGRFPFRLTEIRSSEQHGEEKDDGE